MAARKPPGGVRIGGSNTSTVTPPVDKDISPSDHKSETNIKSDTKKTHKEPKQVNKKRLGATIGLQFLGLVMLIVGLVFNVMMGLESQPNEERTEALVGQYKEIQDEMRSIDGAIGALPSAAVAKRWTESANTHGEAVALKQSGLIAEALGLSYDGIPTEHNVEGESEPVPYTEAEREELALIASNERTQTYLREMSSLFGVVDADERGFSAAGPWYRQLGIEPAKGRTWSFYAPGYFDENGSIPVAWTMFDADGSPIALVQGNYDAEKRVFVDLVASRILQSSRENA